MANGQAMIWIMVSKVLHDHSHSFQGSTSRTNQEEQLDMPKCVPRRTTGMVEWKFSVSVMILQYFEAFVEFRMPWKGGSITGPPIEPCNWAKVGSHPGFTCAVRFSKCFQGSNRGWELSKDVLLTPLASRLASAWPVWGSELRVLSHFKRGWRGQTCTSKVHFS